MNDPLLIKADDFPTLRWPEHFGDLPGHVWWTEGIYETMIFDVYPSRPSRF